MAEEQLEAIASLVVSVYAVSENNSEPHHYGAHWTYKNKNSKDIPLGKSEATFFGNADVDQHASDHELELLINTLRDNMKSIVGVHDLQILRLQITNRPEPDYRRLHGSKREQDEAHRMYPAEKREAPLTEPEFERLTQQLYEEIQQLFPETQP